jgi:hypothetical protein
MERSTPLGLGDSVWSGIRRLKPAATHRWPLPGPLEHGLFWRLRGLSRASRRAMAGGSHT